MPRRWSSDDTATLIWLWERADIDKIAQRLKRTETAIYFKAAALGLLGRQANHVSLKRLMERSGFWKRAVLTAMQRIGVEPHLKKRATPGGCATDPMKRRYAFTIEEADLILAELKKHAGKNRIMPSFVGEWGTGGKPEACLRCGRSDRPHRTKGMCAACAMKVQRGPRKKAPWAGHTTMRQAGILAHRSTKIMLLFAARVGVEVTWVGLVSYVRDEDMLQLLAASMAGGRFVAERPSWGAGKLPPVCLMCERADRRHKAYGLCTACASRVYYARVRFGQS